MKDDEMDDLFRRNADYLAEEPARDFDKAAFWQQLQTELPKKAERGRKPAAWWWAAASVLLAGMGGGIWWMQSAKPKTETLVAQETTPWSPWSATPQTRVAEGTPSVSPQTDDDRGDTSTRHRPRTGGSAADSTKVGPLRGQFAEKSGRVPKQEKTFLAKTTTSDPTPPNLPAPSEIAPTLVTIEYPAVQLPAVESLPAPPEGSTEAALEKPAYRVVHINEIRERKQQEAKARSRVAFRIGLPSGSRMTTQSDNKPLLNIPLQH